MSPFVSVAISLLESEGLGLEAKVAIGEIISGDARFNLLVLDLKSAGTLDEATLMGALEILETVLTDLTASRDSYAKDASELNRLEVVSTLMACASRCGCCWPTLARKNESCSPSEVRSECGGVPPVGGVRRVPSEGFRATLSHGERVLT